MAETIEREYPERETTDPELLVAHAEIAAWRARDYDAER